MASATKHPTWHGAIPLRKPLIWGGAALIVWGVVSSAADLRNAISPHRSSALGMPTYVVTRAHGATVRIQKCYPSWQIVYAEIPKGQIVRMDTTDPNNPTVYTMINGSLTKAVTQLPDEFAPADQGAGDLPDPSRTPFIACLDKAPN